MARSPSRASTGSCPSASRLKQRPSARCCSSSTMRMRLMTPAARGSGSWPQRFGSGGDPRQFERERRAASFAFTLREDPSAMRAGDRADDVEAEARALDLFQPAALHAIEAVEDPFQLLFGNPDAPVLHSHP